MGDWKNLIFWLLSSGVLRELNSTMPETKPKVPIFLMMFQTYEKMLLTFDEEFYPKVSSLFQIFHLVFQIQDNVLTTRFTKDESKSWRRYRIVHSGVHHVIPLNCSKQRQVKIRVVSFYEYKWDSQPTQPLHFFLFLFLFAVENSDTIQISVTSRRYWVNQE